MTHNSAFLNITHSLDSSREYSLLLDGRATQVAFRNHRTSRSIALGEVKEADMVQPNNGMHMITVTLVGDYWRYDGDLKLIRIAGEDLRRPRHARWQHLFAIDPTWSLWRFEAECRILFGSSHPVQLPGRHLHEAVKSGAFTAIRFMRDELDESRYCLWSDRDQQYCTFAVHRPDGAIELTNTAHHPVSE